MKRLFVVVALFAAMLFTLVFLWPKKEAPPSSPTKPKLAPVLQKKTNDSPTLRMAYDNDPKGGLVLEGQVVDAEGLPVEGAVVALDSFPQREAKTNAYGWFSFEGLIGRPYRLEANKDDGFAGPLEVKLTEESGPVILKLFGGASLKARVVDVRDQRPIPGALITLVGIGRRSAISDAGGIALLRGVSAGWYTLEVRAQGYGPAFLRVSASGAAGLVEEKLVSLSPGAEASGVVLSPDGRPLPGATVLAEPSAVVMLFSLGGDEVVTDAQGRFSFDALAAGSYRFRARHQSYAPVSSSLITLDGETPKRDISISLEEAGSITGFVLTKDGAPAPFASVRLVYGKDPFLKPSRQLSCDANGAFLAEGVPRAEIALQASHERGNAAPAFVDLRDQPSADVTLNLSEEGSIGGIVVSPSGEPIPDVIVKVAGYQPLLSLPVAIASQTTDPDGRFLLTGLAEGEYELFALYPGAFFNEIPLMGSDNLQARTTAKTGSKDARIVLEPLGAIHGRLAFEEGGAPQRFSVYVQSAGLVLTPFEDTNGAFSIKNIPAGKQEFGFLGPEFLGLHEDPKVEVRAGEDVDVGIIKVKRGRSIKGRVLTERGIPVSGARVVASRHLGADLFIQFLGWFEDYSPGGGKDTRTGEDGRFILAGMTDEVMLLGAEHPTLGRSEVKLIEGDAAETTLTLLPFGTIEGTLRRGGIPIQGLITLEQIFTDKTAKDPDLSEHRLTFMVTSETDGRYLFERLPAGSYVVSYGADYRLSIVVIITDDRGGEAKTKEATIAAGETLTLDLDFPANPALTMTVYNAQGEATDSRIYLFSGQVNLRNIADLNKALMASPGVRRLSTGMGFPRLSLPVGTEVEAEITPGSYTACAHLGEPSDNETAAVYCQPLTVSASPDIQELVIRLP